MASTRHRERWAACSAAHEVLRCGGARGETARPMISLSLVLLAVGLAMDAMAVAMTTGFSAPRVRLRDALLLAFVFGAFQAGMPLLGYLAGDRFADLIEAWDHWAAFVLLAGIGVKMIHEGLTHEHHGPDSARADPFHLRGLLVLGVATSIDALVAGLTLAFVSAEIVTAIAVIGLITFVLSFIGVEVGRRFGDRLGGRFDVLGGFILIGIGAKTLAEHLLAD